MMMLPMRAKRTIVLGRMLPSPPITQRPLFGRTVNDYLVAALPGPGQGVEGGGGEVGQAKQQGGNLWMIFDSMLCFALPMKVEERAWGRLLVGRMVEEGKL